VTLLGALILLSGWWGMPGSAVAASYPPALGCAVSSIAPAGSGLLQVRGTGFGAGSRVVIGVAGRNTGTVTADTTGSFQATVLAGGLAAGATVTAADASCAATGALTIENGQGGSGNSLLPPVTSGPGPAAAPPGPTGPAKRRGAHPAPSPTSPEPTPPVRPAGPPAVAIPAIPLTGLPPQLFLGVAGAVLLAGAGLIGLTGRLGHRSEHPARPAVTSAPPAPGAA
jgi:hypothetical protein